VTVNGVEKMITKSPRERPRRQSLPLTTRPRSIRRSRRRTGSAGLSIKKRPAQFTVS